MRQRSFAQKIGNLHVFEITSTNRQRCYHIFASYIIPAKPIYATPSAFSSTLYKNLKSAPWKRITQTGHPTGHQIETNNQDRLSRLLHYIFIAIRMISTQFTICSLISEYLLHPPIASCRLISSVFHFVIRFCFCFRSVSSGMAQMHCIVQNCPTLAKPHGSCSCSQFGVKLDSKFLQLYLN